MIEGQLYFHVLKAQNLFSLIFPDNSCFDRHDGHWKTFKLSFADGFNISVDGADLGAFVLAKCFMSQISINDIFQNAQILELFFPVLQNAFLGRQCFNLVAVVEEDDNEMVLDDRPAEAPAEANFEVCIFA